MPTLAGFRRPPASGALGAQVGRADQQPRVLIQQGAAADHDRVDRRPQHIDSLAVALRRNCRPAAFEGVDLAIQGRGHVDEHPRPIVQR